MEKAGSIGILIFFLTVSWGSLSHAQTPSSDINGMIDPKLRVPQGYAIQQSLLAVGFQIYKFNGTAWAVKNVSCHLFDNKGRRVGFHFYLKEKDVNGGQATWETFKPQSRVTAKPIASVSQQHAIPFLLLETTSHYGDRRRLGSTSFVQRLFTVRGLPPSAEKAKTGDVYESDYTAIYMFSSPKDRGK